MALLFLLAALASAQAPPTDASLRAGPIYARDFPTLDIVLEIAVAKRAAPTPEVQASDLVLVEDGVRTATAEGLRKFGETGQGIAVVVTLDASGSMRGQPLDAVRKGLGQFVSKARAGDRVAIATFADDVRWETDWSTPPEQIRDRIAALEARGSRTVLWDALDAALDRFGSADLPLRRHLVVISDGHDEGSVKTFSDVLSKAMRLHIPVDSIGLTRSDPKYLENLRTLSLRTQGTYSRATGLDSLTQLVGSGIDQLLDSPVARFRAQNVTADGAAHRLGVFWKTTGLHDEISLVIPASSSQSGPRQNAPQQAKEQEQPPAGRDAFHWWQVAIAAGAGAILIVAGLLLMLSRRRKKGAKRPSYLDIQPIPVAIGPDDPRPEAPFMGPPLMDSPAMDSPAISSPAMDAPPPAPPPMATPPMEPFVPAVAPPPPPPIRPADQSSPPPSSQQPPHARPRTKFAAFFGAAANGSPLAVLVGQEGPLAGKAFPIDHADFWIGGAENNHLSIPDEAVSGNHAWFRFEAGTLRIFDNRSTNNTWVNDQPLGETARVLSPGDRIRVGRSVFTIERAENFAQSPGASALS